MKVSNKIYSRNRNLFHGACNFLACLGQIATQVKVGAVFGIAARQTLPSREKNFTV